MAFRHPRTSQPQGAVGIDWSNPDARGLISFVDVNGGPARDLVKRASVGPVNISQRVTQKGVYQAFNGSSSRFGYGRLVFNSLAKGTAIVRFRMDSFGTQLIWYEAGSAINQFALIAPSSTGGNLVLNMGGNTARTCAKSSWTLGQLYTVAVCWDVDINVYIDGVLDSTFAGVGGCNSGTLANSYCSLGTYDLSGTVGQFFNGLIGPAEVYSRKLDAGAVSRRTINPSGIYSPQARQIWVPTAGGGATVIPVGVAATPSVGTPTATGQALALPNGVAASSGVGSPVAVAGGAATVNPAGVVATASVGTPAGLGAALGQVSGVGTTASVGVPAAAGEALAAPSGVAASPSVGAPVAIGGTSGAATVVPDGVQAAASIGALIATGAAWCVPGGVVASASVGLPVANGDIPVDADWLPVDDTTWSLQSLRRQWSFDIGAREWRFQMQRRDWPIDKNSP